MSEKAGVDIEHTKKTQRTRLNIAIVNMQSVLDDNMQFKQAFGRGLAPAPTNRKISTVIAKIKKILPDFR